MDKYGEWWVLVNHKGMTVEDVAVEEGVSVNVVKEALYYIMEGVFPLPTVERVDISE